MSEGKNQEPTDLFIKVSETISGIVGDSPTDKPNRYLILHQWRVGKTTVLCQLIESANVPDPTLCLDFTGTLYPEHREVVEGVVAAIIRAFRWRVFWGTLLSSRKTRIVCRGYPKWGFFTTSNWLAREIALRLSTR